MKAHWNCRREACQLRQGQRGTIATNRTVLKRSNQRENNTTKNISSQIVIMNRAVPKAKFSRLHELFPTLQLYVLYMFCFRCISSFWRFCPPLKRYDVMINSQYVNTSAGQGKNCNLFQYYSSSHFAKSKARWYWFC